MSNNFLFLSSRIIKVEKIITAYPETENLINIEMEDVSGVIQINMLWDDFKATVKDVINKTGDYHVEDNNGGRENAEERDQGPNCGEIQGGENNPSDDAARGQNAVCGHGSGDVVDSRLEGRLDRDDGRGQDSRLADDENDIIVDKRTKQNPKAD